MPMLKILLVEDHEDMAEVMTEILRSYGYSVSLATTMAGGLAMATGQEEIDLLISDMSLPDGNGLDLMRQLRQKRSIKGICLSGYGEEYADAAREAGFGAFLTKPVTPDAINSAIVHLFNSGTTNQALDSMARSDEF